MPMPCQSPRTGVGRRDFEIGTTMRPYSCFSKDRKVGTSILSLKLRFLHTFLVCSVSQTQPCLQSGKAGTRVSLTQPVLKELTISPWSYDLLCVPLLTIPCFQLSSGDGLDLVATKGVKQPVCVSEGSGALETLRPETLSL